MTTLTSHLLAKPTPTPYASAISHPFLTASSTLTLTSPRLSFWLYQDRIYASQAYPRLISQLITKIPLDAPAASHHHHHHHHHHGTSADDLTLPSRTLQTLVTCLSSIIREIAFFSSTSQKYNLNLDGWKERKATRDYTAEMARIGSLGSLEDGLVFLWAMEKVYLDAWTSVYSALSTTTPTTDVGRALKDLSYNWSGENKAFAEFVKNIGDLVDDYFAPAMAGKAVGGREAPDAIARAEAIWARVVELEAEFWPNEGEEDVLVVGK